MDSANKMNAAHSYQVLVRHGRIVSNILKVFIIIKFFEALCICIIGSNSPVIIQIFIAILQASCGRIICRQPQLIHRLCQCLCRRCRRAKCSSLRRGNAIGQR